MALKLSWIVAMTVLICSDIVDGGHIIRKKRNHNKHRGNILNYYGKRNDYSDGTIHSRHRIKNQKHYMHDMPQYYSGMYEMNNLMSSSSDDDDNYSRQDEIYSSGICFFYSEMDLSDLGDDPLHIAEAVLLILALCGIVIICVGICVDKIECINVNMEGTKWFWITFSLFWCLIIVTLIIVAIIDCAENL